MMNTQKIFGPWKGFYKHENKRIPEKIRAQKTIFTIEINTTKGINFIGTIEEDPNSGGMNGVGIITGYIKNDRIFFIKEMPIETQIIGNDIVETDKKHPKLYYKGKFNSLTNMWEGTWKFKFGFTRVYGRLSFVPPIKGIWAMEKIDTPK